MTSLIHPDDHQNRNSALIFTRTMSFFGLFQIIMAFLIGKITSIDFRYGFLIVFLIICGESPRVSHLIQAKAACSELPWRLRLKKIAFSFIMAIMILVNIALMIVNAMLFRDRHLVLNASRDFWSGVTLFFLSFLIFAFLIFYLYRYAQSQGIPFYKKIFRHFQPLFVILSIILVIFTLEVFASVFIAINPNSWNGYHVGDIILNYRVPESVDWDQFLYEAYIFDHSDYRVMDQEAGVEVHVNYSGEYLNVVNHLRVTPNQPEDYDHTVYVFGGSTVFCSESPDAYTLPAYLQSLFLTESIVKGKRYRVVNMGVKGYLVSEQVIRLKALDLRPGDIVIFFDGFNDAARYFLQDFYGKNDLTAKGIRKWALALPSVFSQRSAFYEYFLAPYNYKPAIVRDTAAIEQRISLMSEEVAENVRQAQDYVKTSGGMFIHFLQPTLFTLSVFTPQEEAMVHAYWITPNGLPEVLVQSYQALIDLQVLYENQNVTSIDLTDALNPEHRLSEHSIFYDAVHVSCEGNQILAQAIFKHIQSFLDEPGQDN